MRKPSISLIIFILIFFLIIILYLSVFFPEEGDLLKDKIQEIRNYRLGAVLLGGAYVDALEGLKDGLTELGYKDKSNIFYEVKNTEGNQEALAGAIRELMKRRQDVIYTISTPVTKEVWEIVGAEAPIVFNIVGDPVGSGFVKDYTASATNLTGCSNLSAELSGKRLEIFSEAFPTMKKIVTFYNPDNSFSQISIGYTRQTAENININLTEVQVTDINSLEDSLTKINKEDYDGIYITPDAMVVSKVDLTIDKAIELGIPTMGHVESLAQKGVTLTYGADFYKLGVQCAKTVDKILKGVEPSAIPIQTPEKLDIVVNLNNLRKINLFISPEILSRADKSIK